MTSVAPVQAGWIRDCAPSTLVFSQDWFPRVQQCEPNKECLMLATMLFSTHSSFSHISLLYAPVSCPPECPRLQTPSLCPEYAMSHKQWEKHYTSWYEMPPMPTSQAIDPALPFSLFSDAWTWWQSLSFTISLLVLCQLCLRNPETSNLI